MSRPTRLAVDGRVLDDRYHGIGRTTEALLEGLARSPQLDVTVFTWPGQRTRRFDLDGIIEGSGMRRAEFAHSLSSPLQYPRWPGALRAVGAEVSLFPYHIGAPVWGPPRRWAVVHDCIIEADPRYAPDAKTRLLYPLLTRLTLRGNQVLTPSRASAAEISRVYGCAVDARHVTPWGVSGTFSGAAAVPEAVGGHPVPRRYHLHVGAHRPHKNVEVLVRALELLPEEDHLVLVGVSDPRWPDPVPELTARLDLTHRVHLFPQVDEEELLGLYAGARTFVYPSFVEGFGLPLLEAMAAGVPVVASSIDVFEEVGGDAVEWADPGAPSSWATAIVRANSPGRRTELVARGRARAERAQWATAVDRVVEALTGVTVMVREGSS